MNIPQNPDLFELLNQGYDLGIVDGYIILDHIPYVTSQNTVEYGALFCPFNTQGEKLTQKDHTVFFSGDLNKEVYDSFINSENRTVKVDNLASVYYLSRKPPGGYKDFAAKMITYSNALCEKAWKIDSEKTPFVSVPSRRHGLESEVFCYPDTASSRCGITGFKGVFEKQKIGIIGCGGTGSYILDFVSKTPVAEIHLFDGDRFSCHNAFRAPGAVSCDELAKNYTKADYFCSVYSRIHKRIFSHPVAICDGNVSELDDLSFVFLCVDNSKARSLICNYLRSKGKDFVDVGMGLSMPEEKISGVLRSTLLSVGNYEKNWGALPCTGGDGEADDVYSTNIQVADLNALNAIMAVIQWKRFSGIYARNDEHDTCCYTLQFGAFAYADQQKT